MKLFFRSALSAIAATLLTANAWTANSTHDVIVVGAGTAGLYAAKTLIDDGYDVLVIEATGRIGGRVYSAQLGDIRIELGAEEHYTSNNPIYSAVKKKYGNKIYGDIYLGSEAASMDGGTNTCWEKKSAAIKCSNDQDVEETNGFNNWYWKPNLHTDPNSTLAQDVEDKFGVGPGHRAYHLYDEGIAGANYATSLDKIGARSLALQDNQWDLSEGVVGIIDKNRGFSDVLEGVWWKDVMAGSTLLLSSPVTAIDTRGDDVIVTTESGDLHAARQVIVTVSLGVLQAEKINFTPNLPAKTVSAYKGIGIDQGMKVAMRFKSAWWETEGQLSWITTEGLASGCWVPSDYKSGSESHIMMCYPMGDNGQRLSEIAAAADEGTGDKAIVNAILADLDITFPQAVGAASENYVDSIVQNWGAHPYTLGVYSYPKVGTYSTAKESKRKDLQAPVAGNRIFFAGEASHTTHPATVVGALHEGERAANNIHKINGHPNNPPPLPTDDGVVDSVIFGTAKYNRSNGKLTVVARSSEGVDDIKLTLVDYGEMPIHPKKNDRFRMVIKMDEADVPATITVMSSRGGINTKIVGFKN
ncbi:monoamine oxidase [Sinobacterium caligoides]|uniref:Tryptophan 2-monooxygenase n=1 Tax=Sinobacterium caligoides TaxID=933926 RepID=A0A3N2DE16_9GAMM|nr:NAD(P)/FAD-dependent oxidoreductase [Sinobacterium caligoides]ROR97967.1 monoamine oxidase [Sinobacterium caligoides]